MILIYTGAGKGKTCACVGQTVRALAHGMDVVFAQLIKRDNVSGEQTILRKLLGNKFRAGGLGFFRHEEERSAHREAALEVFLWALRQCSQMLVLDEILYALGMGLILQEELAGILPEFRGQERILVLSGRGLPPWLEPHADIITEMNCIKHALDSGVVAAKGIEY